MRIETDRLLFVTILNEDIDNIHKLNSEPEVARFSLHDIPKDIEETRRCVEPFIKSQNEIPRKNFTFKILTKASSEFIGITGITLSLDLFRSGEIYYKLLPKYWNCGFATEISKKLIEIGFKELNLHRIEASTDTDNGKSVKVLEKSGMLREGIRRKVVPMNGEWKDGYLYAIVEEDYCS